MDKQQSWQRTLSWVVVFSIAMGFLETAVVIYLRRIYYPYGFSFPLAPIDPSTAFIEVGREVATVVMLIGIGVIAGRTLSSRFAYFILSFAVWDIFYYIFLKILIDWPDSWMTWDILFLIPVTWIGPVIAPVIISVTMTAMALLIIINEGKGKVVSIDWIVWILLIIGSLVLIVSFVWDYTSYMLSYFSFKEIWSAPGNNDLFEKAYSYIPRSFNWKLFSLGELIIISGIIKITYSAGIIRFKRVKKVSD